METTALLLEHEDPALRFQALTRLVDRPAAGRAEAARRAIVGSERVTRLLSERDRQGQIPRHPYHKWAGAHWVLVTLAELGYPPGDESLLPLREQVHAWLLGEAHRRNIREVDGRVRRCASQEGNALFAMLALGIADERSDELARRLVSWQWPDGGWNCDKRPSVTRSSFMESLIPMRALHLHGRVTGDRASLEAAARAREVFLRRRLFKRRSDGTIMKHDFTKLHYPCYWHYDVLFALKVLAEMQCVGADHRCGDALELLEAKRLEDGGFPAEGRYYRCTQSARTGLSLVDWGGTSRVRMNPWITLDALAALKAGGQVRAGVANA